jgi:hypothetical protein
MNGYLETSFLPGRSFRSPADFNGQLTGWLVGANQRHHRIIGCRPVDRIAEDRAAMLALPPILPDPAFEYPPRPGPLGPPSHNLPLADSRLSWSAPLDPQSGPAVSCRKSIAERARRYRHGQGETSNDDHGCGG